MSAARAHLSILSLAMAACPLIEASYNGALFSQPVERSAWAEVYP